MISLKKIKYSLFFILFCIPYTAFSNEIEIQESALIFDLCFPQESSEQVFIEEMELLDKNRIPKHVCISTDGSRRWAKKRGVPISEGHWRGAKNIFRIIKFAAQLGIKTVTVGLSTTDNHNKRSPEEIQEMMKIMTHYLQEKRLDFKKYPVRLKMIGDLSKLPSSIQEDLERLERESSSNTEFTVVFALNYGGRDDIKRAFTKMASDLEKGVIVKERISENLISSYLDTANIGDPDLFIRTSGELRFSNADLWGLIYTELYFTPVLWPDFTEKDFIEALLDYQKRSQRFGG